MAVDNGVAQPYASDFHGLWWEILEAVGRVNKERLQQLLYEISCSRAILENILVLNLLAYSICTRSPKYICGENHSQVHCSPYIAFAVFNIYGHMSYRTYDVFWVSNVSVTHHV